MKKRIVAILFVLVFITLAGIGCKKTGPTKKEQQALKLVILEYWRVFDDGGAFDAQIQKYQQLHSHVRVNYRRLRFDEYQKELLNAFAEDRGPDIFAVHNTWMREYKNKLLAKPDQVTVATQFIKRGMKKEIVIDVTKRPTISLKQIRDNFVDVVYDDVVLKDYDKETKEVSDKVYGLPLSVDTLVLLYNKDLLNNAGIPQPPKSWSEFQQYTKRITQYDSKGDIILSGGAIGTIDNISRGTDILALLMMQNGANMMTDDGSVQFHLIPNDQRERTAPPGVEALQFYTDFASPIKDVYTWNNDMKNSLDVFTSGQTAFAFAYAYHLPAIKKRAPKLNLGIAPVPQILGNPVINIANYWVESVSKKTTHPDEAWDFVQFLTNEENAKIYTSYTKKPTALRSLIVEQLNDQDIGTFASQVLTAKSWYRGNDAIATESIFSDMVNDMLNGVDLPLKIIKRGAGRVQDTVKYEY